MSCDLQVSHVGCVSTAWAVTNQCDGAHSTEGENIQRCTGLLLVGTGHTPVCTSTRMTTVRIHV